MAAMLAMSRRIVDAVCQVAVFGQAGRRVRLFPEKLEGALLNFVEELFVSGGELCWLGRCTHFFAACAASARAKAPSLNTEAHAPNPTKSRSIERRECSMRAASKRFYSGGCADARSEEDTSRPSLRSRRARRRSKRARRRVWMWAAINPSAVARGEARRVLRERFRWRAAARARAVRGISRAVRKLRSLRANCRAAFANARWRRNDRPRAWRLARENVAPARLAWAGNSSAASVDQRHRAFIQPASARGIATAFADARRTEKLKGIAAVLFRIGKHLHYAGGEAGESAQVHLIVQEDGNERIGRSAAKKIEIDLRECIRTSHRRRDSSRARGARVPAGARSRGAAATDCATDAENPGARAARETRIERVMR